MLQHFSSSQFIGVILMLTGIYYLVVLLVYFRKEIKELLFGRSIKATGHDPPEAQ